jgi:hypothetical protein
MNLENSFWPAFLNYPVGWVKERRDEPTVSKAMGIAESILRDVEGLNPSYMTVSFNTVHKIALRPQFSMRDSTYATLLDLISSSVILTYSCLPGNIEPGPRKME